MVSEWGMLMDAMESSKSGVSGLDVGLETEKVISCAVLASKEKVG